MDDLRVLQLILDGCLGQNPFCVSLNMRNWYLSFLLCSDIYQIYAANSNKHPCSVLILFKNKTDNKYWVFLRYIIIQRLILPTLTPLTWNVST